MVASYNECMDCERLVNARQDNVIKFPTYYNKPVPADGYEKTKFLIVGLAPGLHGANATGLPFNGDFAGRFLKQNLEENGFKLSRERKSGAINYCITNAVKCFPPLNRPLQSEINNCLRHLKKELSVIQPYFILCLGAVAHNAVMKACKKDVLIKFQHGNSFRVGQRIIFDSYHPSKRNISTKRLTTAMFRIILKKIREEIEKVNPVE
ncbi:uracil-DNA glycosylase [Betaproteobacteria bacterium]|nr:uracil-DNA glycosylase [Betaproteobacteria bacterium]